VFGSCIHILYTGCAKIKKNNSGAKRLKELKVPNNYKAIELCYVWDYDDYGKRPL
jgi:hypothetical protein